MAIYFVITYVANYPLKRVSRLIMIVFGSILLIGACRAGLLLYYYNVGRNLFKAKKFKAAIDRYERVKSLDRRLMINTLADRYLSDMAYVYLKEGKEGKAQDIVDEVRKRCYKESLAYRKVGDIYYRAGIWERAVEEYKKYLNNSKEGDYDTDVLEKMGSCYWAMGNREALLDLVDRYGYVPKLKANSYDEAIFLGNLCLTRRDLSRALEYFKVASGLKPADFYVYYKLGIVMLDMGNFKEASQALLKSLELNPKFSDGHYRLGVCYERMGKKEEAIKEYETAVRLLPDHIDGLEALGRKEASELTPNFKVGRKLPGGIELLGYDIVPALQPIDEVPSKDWCLDEPILKRMPDFYMVFYWKAWDLVRRDYRATLRFKDFVRSWNVGSLGYGKQSSTSEWKIGEVVREVFHFDAPKHFMTDWGTETDWGKVKLWIGEDKVYLGMLHFDDKLGAFHLGKLYSEHGLWKEAASEFALFSELADERDMDRLEEMSEYLHKAKDVVPHDPYLWFSLGRFYEVRRLWKKALECFEKASAAKRNFAEAYYHLGACLENLGRREEAIGAYEEALKYDPMHVYAFSHLERLYLDKGSVEYAQKRRSEFLKRFRYVVEPEDWIGRGGWVRAWNGESWTNIKLYDGVVEIKLFAWGTPAAGIWPHMVVKLDDKVIGEVEVSSKDPKPYVFTTKVRTGDHRLSAWFTNDGGNVTEDGRCEDRNLLLGRCEVYYVQPSFQAS